MRQCVRCVAILAVRPSTLGVHFRVPTEREIVTITTNWEDGHLSRTGGIVIELDHTPTAAGTKF